MAAALTCGLALMAVLNLPLDRVDAVRAVAKHGNKNIMVIAAIESGYDQTAVSEAGAVGVMQVTPIAIRQVYRVGCPVGLPAEPDVTKLQHNVIFGYCFYSYLTALYEDDIIEALAHYNGGGYAVTRMRNFLNIPSETAQYIVKFITLKRKVPECVSI